jgi:hypothetical protein
MSESHYILLYSSASLVHIILSYIGNSLCNKNTLIDMKSLKLVLNPALKTFVD